MSQLFKDMNSSQADEFLFKEYCPELLKTPLSVLPDISERNETVESVTEEFYSSFSKMPSSRVLQQFSDYLLLDHIKDTDQTKKDKLSIMTERQMGTRRKNEAMLTAEHMDHFSAKQQWNFATKRNTQEREVD